MKNTYGITLTLLLITCVLLSACRSSAAPTLTPSQDKLAEIVERGRLIIATDPAYPPQSELRSEGERTANTKCVPTEYTASELTGFDVDVAVEIARRMGLEACFVTPAWTQITSGSWDDHWDISVGSMAITTERLQLLYFAQPYYTAPAALLVHKDNAAFTQPSQLSGKRIGVCAGCTYEYYLQGSLKMPGQTIDFGVHDAVIVAYDTEIPALNDLALGDGVRLDAVLTGQPLGESMMASGMPVKQLGGPVFTEYLAAAIDKKSSKDPLGLVRRVSETIQDMHSDGTLLRLSQQYYGLDFTTTASQFDLQVLGQVPQSAEGSPAPAAPSEPGKGSD